MANDWILELERTTKLSYIGGWVWVRTTYYQSAGTYYLGSYYENDQYAFLKEYPYTFLADHEYKIEIITQSALQDKVIKTFDGANPGNLDMQISLDANIAPKFYLYKRLKNQSPTVTLTSPTNNQTIKQGTDIDFKWSGSDSDGDALTYTLQVGTSAGASNIYNASVGSATSKKGISTSWAVGFYYWRVIANDGKGGVTTSAEGVFSLAQGRLVTLTKSNSVAYDTLLQELYPTTNYYNASSLAVGMASGYLSRSQIFFDFGAIPNDVVINSAFLNLYQAASSSGTRIYDVHPLTSAWQESIPTWNAPTPFNPFKKTSLTVGSAAGTISFDVKQLVQEMVNGTYANFGFLIKDSDETTNSTSKGFNSLDYTSNQPTLTIDYSIPTTGKKQVEYVGNNWSHNGGGTGVSLVLPAGTTAGDLLIASVNLASSATITPPSGWVTAVDTVVVGRRYAVYYKNMQPGETSYSFTSTANTEWNARILAYRNVKGVQTVKTNSYSSEAASFSPGNTYATTDNTMFVLVTQVSGNYSFNTPLNYNAAFNYISVSDPIAISNGYMHKKRSQATEDMYTRLVAQNAYGISSALVLDPFSNNPPTLTLTSPANNQTLSEGSTCKLEGTVSDVDAGQSLSVKYSIAGGPTQSITVGTSDGSNPKPFSKTLTYSQGRFWDGSTDVSGLLPAEASSIQIWANDGTDDSAKQTRNFTVVQEDGKIYVPVNVVSQSYLVSKMASPVRLSNGWLVGVVRGNSDNLLYVYVSKDNGKAWVFLTKSSIPSNNSFSVVSKGTFIYIFGTDSSYSVISVSWFNVAIYSNATYSNNLNLDSGNISWGSGLTASISPDGTKLWWGVSSKNSAYQNSFNIRAGSIPINADGTLGTPNAAQQLTSSNTSGQDYLDPSIFIRSGSVHILSSYQSAIFERYWNGVNWFTSTVFTSGNNLYPQSKPQIIGDANNKLYAVWHGTDVADSSNNYVRFNVATGSIWGTAKKLAKGTNASITSDKNGKVIITYEDGGYIKRIESSNEFSSFAGPFVDGVGTNPATFYDPTFQRDFSIPPTIYQAAGKVKYRGVLNLNKRPVVTLDTPDNQALTENSTLKVSGQAVDEDTGNIVSIFYKINSGPTQASASDISDGSTPILFDKRLTYRNKRIYLDATDIVGVDLPENTDHILTVWVEDNKQGKSLEVVRKFRVVWNRPPVINGEDKDLGIFMKPPSVNYSATDPEANTFTFSEYLNGKQIRSFAGVAGQQYTVEISHDAWIRLDLDAQHQIKIVATDSAGISSERIYTFTRTETHIEFMLEYGNPDIKADFTLDGMPLRVLMTLERYLPEGSSIESVKVCNNYLDNVPTWEDCTNAVKVNRGYLFTNKNKTAPEWAINLWVTINKGTARERVLVNGYGGAFD
ncbi:DNRLRE domain-containing protein [Brevibacillus sp. BC25]|uniref:DNRLRE domain-containing protein n=1 Tax=Brevibacillus sp. BC25 TaxID=1144308 RepID=UPI00027147A8|nr:DNRLRE domain-containing protein [Brevibacillus sp. BC25]EJL24593.1 hypothetical protein PMI05_04179 [Brevibacillus sp. BC25]